MSGERLYNLLPAIYRERDFAQGEPLRALCAVLETEYRVLEQDVDALYDNWFIETCDEWLVPYIGELLGIRGLDAPARLAVSQRALVANTIRYRRRKGTPGALAGAAGDASGWPVQIVEAFERLATTQSLRHVRPGKGGTADLRDPRVQYPDAPFSPAARTADVRVSNNFNTGVGPRFGVHQLVMYIWRLRSYFVSRRQARPLQPGCYTVHPFGIDTPLFSYPASRLVGDNDDFERPEPLRPALVHAEIEARRRGIPALTRYFHAPAAFTVYVRWASDQTLQAVDPAQLQIVDLDDWRRPTGARTIAVDVARGRLAFARDESPREVEVSYAHGFGGDLGGGPYDRRASLSAASANGWKAIVGRSFNADVDGTATASATHRFDSLQGALHAWAATGQSGVIEISDNANYATSTGDVAAAIALEANRELVIQAADGCCPGVLGDLSVTGSGRLRINGILIDGSIRLADGVQLELFHCTLRPRTEPSIAFSGGDATGLCVSLSHCICGAISLPCEADSIVAHDSIVGAVSGAADPDGANSPGPSVAFERSTVFGPVTSRALEHASETIFAAPLRVARAHTGYLRFCYVPHGSRTPRRYHCQPDLALERAESEGETLALRRRLRPRLRSHLFGEPGYGQLDRHCAIEIRTGAEDGAEMGAFKHSYHAQREQNLLAAVDEYVPLGMQIDPFFIT